MFVLIAAAAFVSTLEVLYACCARAEYSIVHTNLFIHTIVSFPTLLSLFFNLFGNLFSFMNTATAGQFHMKFQSCLVGGRAQRKSNLRVGNPYFR